jgi:hypothetical protein
MNITTIVIVVVLVLVVLASLGVGAYFLYRAITHGLKSGKEDYLVSVEARFNLHKLETLDGIIQDWLDPPMFGMVCERYEAEGNDGTADDLYVNRNVLITVGDMGIPHSVTLTTTDQSIVLFKSGSKSIVLKCKLADESKMANVQYFIFLEGCPNGVKDFTLAELKRFPSVIRMRWYTVNKIAQNIMYIHTPLTSAVDGGDMVFIYAEPGKDNNDVDVKLDLNMIA